MTMKVRLGKVGRQLGISWRYVYNLAPTLAYKLSDHSLSDEGSRVLSNLNRAGVAVTSVEKLLGPNSPYNELSSAVLQAEKDLAAELAAARLHANDATTIGEKAFVFPLIGDRPLLDPDSVYARFALQSPILDITNAYLGMYTRLRHYHVGHTFVTKSAPRESQLWHRDREDRFILKVFVYLSDVNESSGPFSYIPGSHQKGTVRQQASHFVEKDGVSRSTDEQIAELLPSDRWAQCTGPKGTIVFADTRGYHRGGLAREHDRIMYSCMFTSPASESKELLERPGGIGFPISNKQLDYALSPPKSGPWLSWRVAPQRAGNAGQSPR